MGFLSVLSLAQQWAAQRAGPGDAVIDATAGNGVDTLFLARTVGPRGAVYAFDVQRSALDRTRQRLADAAAGADGAKLAPATLVLAGHETMAEHVPSALHGRIRAVMFNLGYLPGADDLSVVTQPATTIAAMETALKLLAPGGLLTAVLYPGHAGGDAEAAEVERWMTAIPGAIAQCVVYRFPQKPAAPYLAALEKR